MMKDNNNSFYIYEWYVVETGEVFYVGKGTKFRYKVRKHNNLFAFYLEHFNCDSRIISYFNKEEDAFKAEFDRINELREKGQCKCNRNDGGFGGKRSWWTDEMRERYSRDNVMKSESQRQRMSIHNPMKNKVVSSKVNEYKLKAVWIGDRRFKSLKEASESFNVSSTAILYWLKRGCSTDGSVCYYDGDKPNEEAKPRGSFKVVSVLVDGIKYRTIGEAAKSIPVAEANLSKALKQGRKCKGHEVRYAD